MGTRCPELVGREAELARLERLVSHVASGRGEALIVRGLAGVGKSALVQRVSELCTARGGSSLVGRSVPSVAVPFRMLTEVVLGALGQGADLDAPELRVHRSALGSVIGEPTRGVGVAPGAGAAHPLVVAEGFARLAAGLGRPVVVVLEDLHWADPDTLAAVEYLCDHGPDRGVGVVATVRSDEPNEALAVADRLAARGSVELLDLAALDADALHEMIRLCLGAPPSPDVTHMIMERSEGRPLVVEELLAAVGVGTADTLKGSVPVPATLVDSVASRLDALTLAPRQMIVLAAQLGIEVPLAILRRLCGLDVDGFASATAAAEHAFIADVAGDSFRFRHALTRDAVLAATPAAQRRHSAAEALAALGDVNVLDDASLEAAAALAPQAGASERVAALHFESGRRALERGALRSAETALRLAQQSAEFDYALRADASAALVEVLALAGHVDDALSEGTNALRMAESRADAGAVRRVRLALIRADLAAERWSAALARLDDVEAEADSGSVAPAMRALGELGAEADSGSVATAMRALGELGAGNADRAAAAARRVVDGADEHTDPAALCEALEVLGRIARAVDLDSAAGWFERAVQVAEGAHLAAWRARAMHERATIRQLDTGLVDQHEAVLDAALDAGALGVATGVLFHMAAVHGVQFEAELGLAEGRRALDLARGLGTPRQAAMAWIVIGQAHASAGRIPQAKAAAGEATSLCPDDPEVRGLAAGACVGLSLLLNERRAEAIEEITAGVAMLESLPTKSPTSAWFMWPVLAAVEQRDAARALAVTDTAELRIARGFDALWLLGAAIDAGRRNDHAGAMALTERSLAQFDRSPGFAGYRHLGLRLAAEAALDDGWADPQPWLVEAESWFRAHELARVAQACRSLGAAAGVPARRRRGDEPPPALAAMGVTSREVDVLGLVGEGLTNRQIGERLYISSSTVKTHVEHLLTKTATGNRAQLAALAATHLGADVT